MTTTTTYQSPALEAMELDENEVLPFIVIAAAKALGVSAAFVVWVCAQCGGCTSLWRTINVVRAWFGSGC